MRPFRFKSLWVRKNDCLSIIEDTWADGVVRRPIVSFLKKCGERLKQWNKTAFGNVQTNLNKDKEVLFKLQEEDPTCSKLNP